MRRVFALLLLTPLLASCSDSVTPVAPSDATRSAGAMHSAGDMQAPGDALTEEAWPAEENWFTPGDALTLADGEMSAQAVGADAAPAPGAVMTFGNADTGTDFHPTGVHDQSYQSRFKINPGAVAIDAGQTVTFNITLGHRVAIYDVGTRPEDIQRTPGPLLLYPTGRLFLQPFPTPQFRLRFVRPGKYLVVCAINMHFFDANMWGWLIVR